MIRQLDTWRSLLPPCLQWSDEDMLQPPESDYPEDELPLPKELECGMNILVAELRSRFYHARFILYRPFVFKALHFPQLMTLHDVDCYVCAVKCACSWPIAMAPAKDAKRLIPHLFTWTQSFIGVLLALWMAANDERTMQLSLEQIDRDEMQRTMVLLRQFILDVKQIDGIADWAWRILEPLFPSQP